MVGVFNRTDKIAPEGKRLGRNRNQISRYADQSQLAARNEGARLAALEKARGHLGDLIRVYAKTLMSTTLTENRSVQDNEAQKQLLNDIPLSAFDLDSRNLGEGTMSVLAALLNASVLQRDQINKLRYQNFILNKKVQNLKDKVVDEDEDSAGTPKEAVEGAEKVEKDDAAEQGPSE